jgi:hypothetical protein
MTTPSIGARVVTEEEFDGAIHRLLSDRKKEMDEIGCVTGPGRSGAIAAVYASHILHVPFIPMGTMPPRHLGRLLIIDTATETGKTLKKAGVKYREYEPLIVAIYHEPPRVMFWYEAGKPQRYRHEGRAA